MTTLRERLHPEVTRAAMRRLDDEEENLRRRLQRKDRGQAGKDSGETLSAAVVVVTVLVLCWCVGPTFAGGSSDTTVATSPFANTTGPHGSPRSEPVFRLLNKAADYQKVQEVLSANQTEDEAAAAVAEVTTPLPGCQSCIFREGLRNLSLQTIKEEILSKLGMKHAPNTTGRQLPKIPPLHHLLQIYEQPGLSGMQGDEPVRTTATFKPGSVEQEEEDDYHARTERVIAFAQPCE
jgi:hypothetical protein